MVGKVSAASRGPGKRVGPRRAASGLPFQSMQPAKGADAAPRPRGSGARRRRATAPASVAWNLAAATAATDLRREPAEASRRSARARPPPSDAVASAPRPRRRRVDTISVTATSVDIGVSTLEPYVSGAARPTSTWRRGPWPLRGRRGDRRFSAASVDVLGAAATESIFATRAFRTSSLPRRPKGARA